MASQKFWLLFDLNIVPMYIPYRSKADDCKISTYGRVQSDNISKACTHTLNCLTWDKQCSKLQSTYGSGNDRVAKVLWTGHMMKDRATSVSRPNVYMAMITPTNSLQDNGEARYGNLLEGYLFGDLTHELSHLLGANDHYCFGKNGNAHCSNPDCDECNKKPLRRCIMRLYVDGMEDQYDIYCDACINVIRNHINAHNK